MASSVSSSQCPNGATLISLSGRNEIRVPPTGAIRAVPGARIHSRRRLSAGLTPTHPWVQSRFPAGAVARRLLAVHGRTGLEQVSFVKFSVNFQARSISGFKGSVRWRLEQQRVRL